MSSGHRHAAIAVLVCAILAGCSGEGTTPDDAWANCISDHAHGPDLANNGPVQVAALYQVTDGDNLELLTEPLGAPKDEVKVSIAGGDIRNFIQRIMSDRDGKRYNVIIARSETFVRVRSEPGDAVQLVEEACSRLSDNVTLQQIEFQLQVGDG